jgi:hypothetical protein
MRSGADRASRDADNGRRASGIGHAVVGASVMALAIGVSTGISAVITQRWGGAG